MIDDKAKIFIAGHQGMVGSAIIRSLTDQGFENLVTRSRGELDLLDQRAVADFFAGSRPDCLVVAAARVGGIHANSTYPAEFIHENLMIVSNLLGAAYQAGCRAGIFLGSSCIYPREGAQPLKESSLLTGQLEPTNEPYAVAKIAGIKLCESYNRQHDTDYRSLMPTNLYGPGDNYHPEDSHVIPHLMRRIHDARESGAPRVAVWGTGTPMREFMHVDDMAAACVHVMKMDQSRFNTHVDPMCSHVNVGTGNEVSILDLAETLRDVIGYGGELELDATKPDGMMRKVLDVSRLASLGWHARIDLREGLERTYVSFLQELSGEDGTTLREQ